MNACTSTERTHKIARLAARASIATFGPWSIKLTPLRIVPPGPVLPMEGPTPWKLPGPQKVDLRSESASTSVHSCRHGSSNGVAERGILAHMAHSWQRALPGEVYTHGDGHILHLYEMARSTTPTRANMPGVPRVPTCDYAPVDPVTGGRRGPSTPATAARRSVSYAGTTTRR